MKRVRYLELAKIADDICVMLLISKVEANEGCVVRRIAETQWDAMRHQSWIDDPAMTNAVQPVDPNQH